MSRGYEGKWRVRVVFTHYGERLHDYTLPMTYEQAEGLCLLLGLGVTYRYGAMWNVRVERARIVAGGTA